MNVIAGTMRVAIIAILRNPRNGKLILANANEAGIERESVNIDAPTMQMKVFQK